MRALIPLGGDTRNGVEKTYSIISAFEVLEHVPNPLEVFDAMVKMLDQKRGLLLISTQLTMATMNVGQLINSWYAAPRNGHISLYSIKTMNYLADKFKFDYRRISRGLHIFSYGLNAEHIEKKLFFSKAFSRLHSIFSK